MSLSDTFSEWTKPLRNLQTSATKGIPSFKPFNIIKQKWHTRETAQTSFALFPMLERLFTVIAFEVAITRYNPSKLGSTLALSQLLDGAGFIFWITFSARKI